MAVRVALLLAACGAARTSHAQQPPPVVVEPATAAPASATLRAGSLVLRAESWAQRDWTRLRALLDADARDARRARYAMGWTVVGLGLSSSVAGAVVLGTGARGSALSPLVGGTMVGLGPVFGLMSLLAFLTGDPREELARSTEALEWDAALTPSARLERIELRLGDMARRAGEQRRFGAVLNLVAFGVCNIALVPLWVLSAPYPFIHPEKDEMTTAAAIDRVVHHATILELNGRSVRAEHAEASRKGTGATTTTLTTTPTTTTTKAEEVGEM